MTDIKYSIIRSDRRTVCITVKPDLSIEVRAPLRMKQSEIESFVLAKRDWIEKATAKMRAATPADFTYGSKIKFFGEELTLTAAECKKAVLSDNLLLVPKGLSSDCIKEQVVGFYRAEAKNYLPERVKEISRETGLKYSSLLINSAKTHWGSCTADRIHLSCLLMAAAPDTVDYVIIHELAHTVHHNHSESFWALVAKHCPDYKARRNELKTITHYNGR
ncbi:MAG: M48 family metallopeptidase [Clostridia bacterium]|nr:M48 family metallopeptidase [Clostridia bacterium]